MQTPVRGLEDDSASVALREAQIARLVATIGAIEARQTTHAVVNAIKTVRQERNRVLHEATPLQCACLI